MLRKWDGIQHVSQNEDGDASTLCSTLYEQMKHKGQHRFIGRAFAILAANEEEQRRAAA